MLSILAAGCVTAPGSQESSAINVSSSELNILETCRKNLSIASPDTLRAAINLLAESGAGKSEAGTEYAYIASELMTLVYPVVIGEIKVPTPPIGSVYPSLFKEVAAGRIPTINQEDTSFLTVLIMPVAVLFTESDAVEAAALDFINQAILMNSESVLPLYLRGLLRERSGRYDEALQDFDKALELDPSCYPAEIGTARIYLQNGQNNAAVEIMDLLAAQYPFSTGILTTAARTRYQVRDYTGALDYSAEVLRIAPDNSEILMLRAKIFLEQGNIQQASRLIEVLDRMGFRNPDFYLVKSGIERSNGDNLSALNTLERGRRDYPGNKAIEEAYGAVLMLAGRKDEAREILTGGGPDQTGSEGLIVLISDAVEQKDWAAAEEYADRLLKADDSLKAGTAAWRVYYLQQKFDRALEIAESLYSRYPDTSDAPIIYIRTLIGLNRRLQAERILSKRLPLEKDAVKRSELYYLKSLTDDTDDAKLQSLRSALFEDLKNIDALVSISRLYTEMGDIRKAYRYIKQASALAPDDEKIRQEMLDLERQVQ